MSMTINTNIDALNALRNLTTTGTAFSSSVQKLSSGLRINTAADDAAGLSIATKLQSQVTGLNQAQRNAQDGVSMVQTAEGALNQVQTMLQRIRELAVEAGNSTLSSSDAASVNVRDHGPPGRDQPHRQLDHLQRPATLSPDSLGRRSPRNLARPSRRNVHLGHRRRRRYRAPRS